MAKLSTRAEAVKALKLPSPRALDRLIERGAPGPKPGKPGSKRYDMSAIRKWMTEREARLRPQLNLADERAALARVQTQVATLKLRELRGELVRASDVLQVQRSIATSAKVALLSVPRRAVMAGVPREYEMLVKKLIVESLRELSEIRTTAGLEHEDRHED